MNKSDCFILDGGKDHPILVFMPPQARKMEQFRAVQVANQIRDEDHAGHAVVEICGEEIYEVSKLFRFPSDQFTGNMKKFFDALGSGSLEDVPEGTEDDEQCEAEATR